MNNLLSAVDQEETSCAERRGYVATSGKGPAGIKDLGEIGHITKRAT
jgi:hypothetical protein